MRRLHPFLFGLLIPLASCSISATLQADEPAPKDIQIDARGPIHEAYAQPHQTNAKPNAPVEKKPPDPIPEEPAEEKPAGKNVQWIPGYWQWDLDRKDYLWVSGFWRDIPEGRRWVAGYHAESPEGWRWVNGHWAAKEERDNQYVPEPPTNPDQGPTTQPPDADSFYVPGTYLYGENGYYYRDGYWSGFRPGLVWVPARYVWTPHGWVFVSGYWDYALDARGLLFAPVYFQRPLWYTPGWFYRPYFALSFGGW